MRKLFFAVSSVAICICLTAIEIPSATALPPRDGAPLQASSNLKNGQPVFIAVSVRDASGQPVHDLKQPDFSVTDNQHAQAITTFREVSGGALGATAHAVVIVDAINDTSSGALSRQVKEIDTFFSGGTGQLSFPISIAVAAAGGFMEGDPSRDRSELIHDLQHFSSGLRVVDCATDNPAKYADDAAQGPAVTESMGQTLDHMEGVEGSGTEVCRKRHLNASLEALRRVANQQASLAGRAVIIWVGPGWSFAGDKSKAAESFADLVKLTGALRDAQATLDFVSTEDFDRAKELRHANWDVLQHGAASAKDTTPASVALPVIARQSGGVVFNKSKDLGKDIAACLAGADNYYLLAFDPSPAPAKDELHSLAVKVNRPGATVSAPALYYGEQ